MNEHGQTSRGAQDEYSESIDYLYNLQYHGIKLGLDNIRKLLGMLDNPQKSFRAVHIAGTNGKGSTSSFIASILIKAGYRVGLFTSPHLVNFTERIRVNGKEINKSEVVRITSNIRELMKDEKNLSPTFFEFVTAMAFQHFREAGTQWAVIETGMGGRLDSTNVLDPKITVITRIGMDHMEFLGNNLADIANEKAGIIKNEIPVVTGLQVKEAENVICKISDERGSPVFRYGIDFSSRLREMGISGTHFDYVSVREINDIFIPLSGTFQTENASVAIKALELIGDPSVNDGTIKDGLSSIHLEGRCELFNWKYPVLYDGAHNTDAARTLRNALKNIYLKEFRNIIFIIGSMADKDIEGLLSTLLPIARLTVFTTLNFERAAKAEQLKSIADRKGRKSIATSNMNNALDAAGEHYKEGDLIVITGSFYAVGEAKGSISQESSSIRLTEFR